MCRNQHDPRELRQRAVRMPAEVTPILDSQALQSGRHHGLGAGPQCILGLPGMWGYQATVSGGVSGQGRSGGAGCSSNAVGCRFARSAAAADAAGRSTRRPPARAAPSGAGFATIPGTC